MLENVIELIGKEEGPTSIILAGVHGDEKCGIEAFDKIIPNLKIKRGRVLLAYGNPLAIKARKRFVEANLNRMFKNDALLTLSERGSYEYKRAQTLKTYLNQAGALLDIHASSNPKSQKFLICERNSLEITKYLPFDLIVRGFDAVEPGGTDYYMNSIGKIGICAECGYIGDLQSSLVAVETILSFLSIRGHIQDKKKEKQVNKQSYIEMYKLYITKTTNFTLLKRFKDFEKISSGQVIGMDGVEKVIAPKDSIILFPHNINYIGGEAFLLGEYKRAPRGFTARGRQSE